MPRLIVPVLACALGVISAVALVSCGGSDAGLLPGTTASEIVKNIDLAQEKLSEQNCAAVQDYAQTISEQVTKLPHSVDSDLRKSLREGASKLQSLADDGCQLTTSEASTTVAPTTDATTDVTTTDEPTTDETTDQTTTQTDTGVSTQTTTTTPTTPTTTVPTTPTTPTTTPTTPVSPGGGVGPGTPSGGQ